MKNPLNELSPGTLGKYIDRAGEDVEHGSYMAGRTHDMSRETSHREAMKARKRRVGAITATRKLVKKAMQKEETDMNEECIQEILDIREDILTEINSDPVIADLRQQYVQAVQEHELYETLSEIDEVLESINEDEELDEVENTVDESTPSGEKVPGAESGAGAEKYVKQVNGKWALVSRKTGRPLKYFASKPSREQADRALRAVEYFKH